MLPGYKHSENRNNLEDFDGVSREDMRLSIKAIILANSIKNGTLQGPRNVQSWLINNLRGEGR